MSSISRQRNGLRPCRSLGAPVLGAVFSPSISRQDACFCYSPRPFPSYKLPRKRFSPSALLPPCRPSRRSSAGQTDSGHSVRAPGTGLCAPQPQFRLPIRGSRSGGFLPFPICLARDVHTLKTGIYYRPLRSPCPRADAARVGIQRDVPVKIWWHLVMLGSDRLKRADTVPDTTMRMRSENRDFRQLHCLETVSPRRAGELRDRGLHEPVSAGPTGFAFAVNMSPAKNAAPGSRTYQ